MSQHNLKVWAIHAGEGGEADAMFLRGFVALDGEVMGDLAKLPDDPAAFKQRARESFPENEEKTIEQWAGEWRRFAHAAQEGDWIVYKSAATGIVHIGRLRGPYTFEPQPDLDHAHVRRVQWVSSCEWRAMPPHLQKVVALPSAFYALTDYWGDLVTMFPEAAGQVGT